MPAAEVHASLEAVLKRLFPAVGHDEARGYAWGGGYVGDGVAASHVAGRTLGDLITGREGEMTALPWVSHRSPTREPEPLRWIGVPASLAVPAGAARQAHEEGPADLNDGGGAAGGTMRTPSRETHRQRRRGQ